MKYLSPYQRENFGLIMDVLLPTEEHGFLHRLEKEKRITT